MTSGVPSKDALSTTMISAPESWRKYSRLFRHSRIVRMIFQVTMMIEIHPLPPFLVLASSLMTEILEFSISVLLLLKTGRRHLRNLDRNIRRQNLRLLFPFENSRTRGDYGKI